MAPFAILRDFIDAAVCSELAFLNRSSLLLLWDGYRYWNSDFPH